MKVKQSLVSAHHNYLVNNRVIPGFVMGDPGSKGDFYFLADFVLPGETTPRCSGRLFDEQGELLVEINWNRLGENPGNCVYRPVRGGFQVVSGAGEVLVAVRTQQFTNGYLTRLQGRAYDRSGSLRMETDGDNVRVEEDELVPLAGPYLEPFSGAARPADAS